MAVGDVISEVLNVPSGGSLIFQPSAGVEAMITAITSGATGVYVYLYDGTLKSYWGTTSDAKFASLKMFVNNSHYLMIFNNDTIAHNIGFTGIQTK